MATPRFGTTPSTDNTSRVLTNYYAEPAYVATLALTPNAANAIYRPATLTGAMTINLTVTSAKVCDRLTFLFVADGTNRVVTFGTGTTSSGTLTVTASKKAAITFMFDGTAYVACGREISA
jgi:hypothetical protein